MRLTRVALEGAVIFAFCALLQLGLIPRQGLWADEFFSLAMATGHSLEHPAERADPALGDYVEATRALPPAAYSHYLEHESPPAGIRRVVRAVFLSDTSPPLYYVLLYGWTHALGTGDFALRLFSVMCSLACFPLIWSIAKKLGGGPAAVYTGILFAVSPLCVFYSTEGRMYSLLLFFSVWMMWLTLRLWDRGTSATRLILWVATGVAGLLTHYFFAFVWIASVLWLQLHPGRFPRKLSIAGACLTFFLVLPWYMHLPESLSQWRVTGDWLSVRPVGYHRIKSFSLLPWSFFSTNPLGGGRPFLHWINVGIFLLLALAALRKLSWSLFSTPRSLIWLWLLSPCFGLAALDLLRGTYVTAVPRYAIAGMPAAFLLVGLGLGSLGRRLRVVLIGMIVFLCLFGVRRLYIAESRNGEPYLQVAKLLAHQVDASDVILVHSIPSGVAGIGRYLGREQTPKDGVSLASWVGQLGQRRIPHDLKALTAGRKRIILLRLHEVYEPAPEQSWLEKNATLAETKRIGAATLYYFVPRDATVFFATPALLSSTRTH
jgi:hypothetical protein